MVSLMATTAANKTASKNTKQKAKVLLDTALLKSHCRVTQSTTASCLVHCIFSFLMQ